MGRRKKLDSQNIRNEKIKAVNNSENIAGEILMCDVDEAMLSERIPPPPTFHNTTHHHQAVVARLVQSAWLTPYPRLLVLMPLQLNQPRHDKLQYRYHSRRISTDGIALNT
ncbi:hypothetical protein CWI39_0210p0010 [Hamiltosporidium magnivora]|uniref:Uncharacterized protein n=1 Tax=Hamiltosporidium magnivora TaxID=148818 RepID=A0A4Q9LJA2_9MICR|nr:hypothetical protein CWI39_0210p0010 [Hamiltosporidium magnivora]